MSARVSRKMPELPPVAVTNLTTMTNVSAMAMGGGNYRFNYTVRNDGSDARPVQVIAVLH